jgi:hypothetical protein
MQSLSLEEQRVLQAELSTGESLLWTGKPNPRVIFHASDWVTIPTGIFVAGFSIFWEAGVGGSGPWRGGGDPSSFMMLWGIPFIIVGQYMLWVRFLYAAWKKTRITYALTNERILVIVAPPQAKVISIYLRSVPGITKDVRADGIGTLKFGDTPPVWGARGTKMLAADGLYLNSATPVFVDIDNASDVADQVTQALKRFHTTSSPSTY